MPNKFYSFLKGQDQLGTPVQIAFKKETGYGTVIGGACSVCISFIFFSFVCVQMYAFLFTP